MPNVGGTLVRTLIGFSLFCLVSAVTSCAGKGETVLLNIHAISSKQESSGSERPLTVAVRPLEDLRAEKSGLGTRTHLWGGTTHFNVAGGTIGEVVSRVLIDHLRQHGWNAYLSTGAAVEEKPDVTLKGQIQDLVANAKSGVGSTKITVGVKVALQGQNAADGSTARLALNGAGEQRVFLFEPTDVQRMVNEVLGESFEKLLTDTKVVDRTLQVK
jgi:hypothetical protein